jgi:hypothetical protein
MTGENFGTKIFYSETGEHVSTPFFGTCQAGAEAREGADDDGSKLADMASQPMERELALMFYVSKLSCTVRIFCESLLLHKGLFSF